MRAAHGNCLVLSIASMRCGVRRACSGNQPRKLARALNCEGCRPGLRHDHRRLLDAVEQTSAC
jgi:hypothetical protein